MNEAMSMDARYTWDAAKGAARYERPRQGRFGWWVLVAVTLAVVLHVVGLWILGRLNLWLELAEFDWSSKNFRVTSLEPTPESVVAPPKEIEVVEAPEDTAELLTELEELLPELDDTELDIVPDLEKPKVALEPLKPAAIGEEDGELLEPLKAPEVQANLEELGRGESLFQEIPDGRVVIEEGSVTGDIPDPDAFLQDAAVRGSGGLEENGILDGYTELGRYLNFDVDQLDKGRAALPSDLLFDFNQAELKESARLGLMKLATLIDRNPQMYCILEGHTDLIGTEDYNLDLSRRRAEAVRNWLVKSLRLDGSHIIVRAYGESKPKVLEGDRDQQSINRRVDILMRKQIPPVEPLPVRVRPNVPEVPDPPRAVPVEEDPPRAIPLEEDPPRAIPVPSGQAFPALPIDR